MGVIAFDVYGTVVDPAGMVIHLRKTFGPLAEQGAELWRQKQLEFCFRRALMRRYTDFDACTAQALAYVTAQLGVNMDEADRCSLLEAYLRLPCFPDVKPALQELKGTGHTLVALTNGTEHSVRALLQYAAIGDCFAMILSADTIKTFKPDPAVYELLEQVGVSTGPTWLVSSNPFDVIGAKSFGIRAVWVNRNSERIFDPWEYKPDAVIGSLQELCSELQRI